MENLGEAHKIIDDVIDSLIESRNSNSEKLIIEATENLLKLRDSLKPLFKEDLGKIEKLSEILTDYTDDEIKEALASASGVDFDFAKACTDEELTNEVKDRGLESRILEDTKDDELVKEIRDRGKWILTHFITDIPTDLIEIAAMENFSTCILSNSLEDALKLEEIMPHLDKLNSYEWRELINKTFKK